VSLQDDDDDAINDANGEEGGDYNRNASSALVAEDDSGEGRGGGWMGKIKSKGIETIQVRSVECDVYGVV
jgi:hypothetical protein